MEYQEFLEEKQKLLTYILEFVDNQDDDESNYTNLMNILNKQNTIKNRGSLQAFLCLLNKISDNHHRSPGFFKKIDKIIIQYKQEIKQTFSNSEIFNIFKSNKRNLLLLFKEKIVDIDQYILDTMNTENLKKNNYPEYFYPEIKDKFPSFQLDINEIDTNDIELFELNREIGENENKICQLIRDDLLDDFIIYINQTNRSLSDMINPSIFETNSFFDKNKTFSETIKPSFFSRNSSSDKKFSLIEYATFFGSIKIFKYLKMNNIEVKKTLLLYAIHGNNTEIIEDIISNDDLKLEAQVKYFEESIKCFHNDIANYYNNLLYSGEFTSLLGNASLLMNFMNYFFFPDQIDNEFVFYQLCNYNLIEFVNFVFDNPNYSKYININNRIIIILIGLF